MGSSRSARSLPACFMYKTGAKSEAGSRMNLALMKGAPALVTYQRSDAAVIFETCCMSGRRLEMWIEGSMFRDMHGPDRSDVRKSVPGNGFGEWMSEPIVL